MAWCYGFIRMLWSASFVVGGTCESMHVVAWTLPLRCAVITHTRMASDNGCSATWDLESRNSAVQLGVEGSWWVGLCAAVQQMTCDPWLYTLLLFCMLLADASRLLFTPWSTSFAARGAMRICLIKSSNLSWQQCRQGRTCVTGLSAPHGHFDWCCAPWHLCRCCAQHEHSSAHDLHGCTNSKVRYGHQMQA